MKKYTISKYYISAYIGSLCLGILSIIMGIWFSRVSVLGNLFTVSGAFIVAFVLWNSYSYFMFSSFCVDMTGITMNIGPKKYYHAWDKVTDYGFVSVYMGNGCLYWLYFSERHLSFEEKRVFLSKTRKELKNVAFFQYYPRTFHEILLTLPDNIASKLAEDEQEIKKRMNLFEKMAHGTGDGSVSQSDGRSDKQ